MKIELIDREGDKFLCEPSRREGYKDKELYIEVTQQGNKSGVFITLDQALLLGAYLNLWLSGGIKE